MIVHITHITHYVPTTYLRRVAARLSGVENLPVVTFVNTVYNIPVFDLVIALAASGQFEQVGAQ